jgi:hypothetical protein
MYIAKMTTNYPEYHGTGYYNFLMSDKRNSLDLQIAEASHDFRLVKVVKTKHRLVSDVIKEFPTKDSLNVEYFE